MKSFQFFFLILLVLFVYQSVFSQSEGNSVKTTSSGKLSPVIYVGGGAAILKTRHETAKNSISNVRMVVSTPIISAHKWNFGVDIEGDYLFNSATNPAVTSVETPDASNPDITYSNSRNTGGFSIGGGPFIMLPIFDKLIFKSSFELLYTNLKQSEQTVVQHYTFGDNTTNFALYSGTSKPTSGLSMMPKLNLTYQFGRVGVWLEGNYLMGSKMSSTISTLKGASIDAKGRVISEGEQVKTTNETKMNGFGINAGISFSLKANTASKLKKKDSMPSRLLMNVANSSINDNDSNPSEPAQAKDFNTTRSNRERGAFVTDGSTTTDSVNSTNSASKLKKKDSMPNRISMTPTTPRQSQGNTFGESVASGVQSGSNNLNGNSDNTTSEQDKISISLDIVSPANGSVYKTSDKIKIQVNSTEKLSEKTVIKIYKVSDDVNFWKKNKDVIDKPIYNPITINTKKSGNSITGEIKPGKLTTGAYQLMVVESDGTTRSNFTIVR